MSQENLDESELTFSVNICFFVITTKIKKKKIM